MTSKKLLILGASIWQLPAIKKALSMGLTVIVADMNPDAIGFNENGVIKEIASTIDKEDVLKIAQKHNIDGIMTVASDMPMRTVAYVSKIMGIVGLTEEAAFNTTNKAAMRKCLNAGGVPIPEFRNVDNYEDYIKALEQIGGKIIVKPEDNAGSRGVSLIEDISDNDAVIRAFEYAKECSRSGGIMVEEYMEGPEVSVETLSVDGVCHVIQITDKLTTGAPHFVEMGHNQPSKHSEETRNRIAEVAKAAVKAVGIKNGPSHTEIKVTGNGPKIVELGARLGGDCITTHLVPLSTGVNMVECCINIALGEKPDIEKKIEKASAIRYMKAGVGLIEAFEGIEEAENVSGIQNVSIVHGVGEQSVEVVNSIERIGFVIAQADTPDNAIAMCNEALGKIKIKIS